jgi:hypothetical protein
MTILNEQSQQPSSTIRTLEQKIEELANTIVGFRNICRDTKKTIMQQMEEVRQLASDLNVDNIQLRKMISQSFTLIGVSKSWLRKLLPESLKYTKHTRKDYLLKQQQQRAPQPLQQMQQQQQQQQQLPPSDDNATKVTTTYDNKELVISKQIQKEEEEEEEQRGIVEELKDKIIIIEKLGQTIKELQRENRCLREIAATKGQQQHQQQEDTFTALGRLEHLKQCVPVRVTFNLKTKTIEFMEIAEDLAKNRCVI